jgi:DNA-binding transcriptional regulator YdaS (Cro superfamily)
VRVLDDDDLLELLRSRVKRAGGQSAFARQCGLQRTYLNRVLSGKKQPGWRSIIDALNLRIVYVPVERRGRADAHALDHDDVLKLLHSRVKSAGGQVAFSRQGVQRTHLNLVLNGRRPLSPSILDALNLRVVYATVGRRPE